MFACLSFSLALQLMQGLLGKLTNVNLTTVMPLLTLSTILGAARIAGNYGVWRDLASHVMSRYRTLPALPVEEYRRQFASLPFTSTREMEGHTHPLSALHRNAGSSFAERFARQVGLEPYYIQMSRSDQRAGRQGCRNYYWAKDLTADSRSEILNPSVENAHCRTLVDVDQYVDMPRELAVHPVPHVLYTFQPSQVARASGEYSYTFMEDNRVQYSVSGGAFYDHHVWNYGVDNLTATTRKFGLPVATSMYLIDRRRVDADHELILLTPIGSWGILTSWLTLFVEWKELCRLKPHVGGGFLRLAVQTAKGLLMSTGRTGMHACVTIPAAEDDAAQLAARNSKVGFTLPQAMSYVPGDRVAATMLHDYHAKNEGHKPDYVFPIEKSVRSYQFSPEEFDPEAKDALIAFMTPFIHGCFAPAVTAANERQCVKGRILDTKPPADLVASPILIQCMEEFLEFLIPEPHKLNPTDEDDLYSRQGRPAQRHILREHEFITDPMRVNKMFVKREAYPDIKDPRSIATINGTDKAAYSKFMYALAEQLKGAPWYAFGITPREVADRVVRVCANARSVSKTDFSRFDGRVSGILRELERLALLRAFAPEWHGEVIRLHSTQYNLKAYGSFGTTYETGTMRLSGSAETALFNGLANAFCAYYALRRTYRGGGFVSPVDAYQGLGIYGGDDGLTADVCPKTYRRAASDLGQKLEIEPVQRGSAGVQFLARVYGPYVWFGDVNSCCDLPRQLAKFHTTVALPSKYGALAKLREKAYAFYLSDRNTPVIGPFVTRVTELGGLPTDYSNICAVWNGDHAPTEQYPNIDEGDWMDGYAVTALPGLDFQRFRTWLEGIASLPDCLRPPLLLEVTAARTAVPVVVDGEVLLPPQQPVARTRLERRAARQRTRPRVRNVEPRGAQAPVENGETVNRGRQAPSVRRASRH